MKRIEITEANLAETCVLHITEPATDGAGRHESYRCRRCGEALTVSALPHVHECVAPAQIEDD
jgi:hypothetical protein